MLKSFSEIKALTTELKNEGKTIVFTNGCFDILHAGHVKYLVDAAGLGDILIIGLNSDASVTRLKGPSRPIITGPDRAAILSALKPVDYVVVFSEDTPYELINIIKPDILVKGGDYDPDDIIGADVVKENGGKVIVIPFLEGRSTSDIISKIKNS